jgi:hypothetical protein
MSYAIMERPLARVGDIPKPSRVQDLMVRAPLGSWDGLSALTALRSIQVRDRAFLPSSEGLGPLGDRPGLRALTLDLDDDVRDVAALGRLAKLDYLHLTYTGSGAALSGPWWTGMVALEELQVVALSATTLEVPLTPLSTLPRLRVLELYGLRPSEGADIFVTGFRALEGLVCSRGSTAEVDRLIAVRHDLSVEMIPDPAVPAGPEVIAHDDGTFSVYLQLAQQLGMDDIEEAVDHVEGLLEQLSAPWAGRISFDPEADGTAVIAPQRDDLEAFLAWLAQLSGAE